MSHGRPAAKESLFLWSAHGIQRIRKRIKDALTPAPLPPVDDGLVTRRFPRLDLRLPILYKPLGEDASLVPSEVRPFLLAKSTNISPLGVCLELSEALAPGTVLALTIHVPDPRETFSAIGRVVWTKPSEKPEHFLTGLQFVIVEGDSVVREAHSKMEGLIQKLERGG